MISGRRRKGQRGRLARLALLGAMFAAHATVPVDVTRLLSLFAARPSRRASFQARTYVKGLTRPLASAGVLTYRAPDRLEQHTLSPVASVMILRGDRLTMRRGTHVRRLDVRAYPQIAVYVTALRDTLAGNASGLEHHFHIAFTGTLAHWQLALTPRGHAPAVSRITLRGAQAHIVWLQIQAHDGDRTVLHIGPAPAP